MHLGSKLGHVALHAVPIFLKYLRETWEADGAEDLRSQKRVAGQRDNQHIWLELSNHSPQWLVHQDLPLCHIPSILGFKTRSQTVSIRLKPSKRQSFEISCWEQTVLCKE